MGRDYLLERAIAWLRRPRLAMSAFSADRPVIVGGLVLVVGGLIAMWPGGAAGGTLRRGQAGYEVRLAGTTSGVGT